MQNALWMIAGKYEHVTLANGQFTYATIDTI